MEEEDGWATSDGLLVGLIREVVLRTEGGRALGHHAGLFEQGPIVLFE